MTNENTELKERLYEEYEHALFKLVVHAAAEKEGEGLLGELDTSPRPSPAALQRFEQQLNAALRPAKKRFLWTAPRRVAVAMLAVVIIFLTAMTTVQAFRVRIMSLWANIGPQSATFWLREKDSDIESDNLVINWTKAYVPTYIPTGYEPRHIEISRLRKEITYMRGESQIKYMELLASKHISVSTEDASRIETVDINGANGMLIASKELVTIVWSVDERMLLVQAQTDTDTALAVAKGVKYVE